MRAVELFSGTKSIGRALEKLGWEVISVDIEARYAPTIVADVMHWDYTALEPGSVQYVHASPVCTHYSIARSHAKTPRDLAGSDAMVLRTLEIIAWLRPLYYTIENPATGLLPKRGLLDNYAFKDVTYCSYGWPYKKWTRLWTNLDNYWAPRPRCRQNCVSCANGKHLFSAQKGPSAGCDAGDTFTREQLYSIPPALCDELAEAVTRGVQDMQDF